MILWRAAGQTHYCVYGAAFEDGTQEGGSADGMDSLQGMGSSKQNASFLGLSISTGTGSLDKVGSLESPVRLGS